MQGLSLNETIYSARNRVFWRLRSLVRYRRKGYQETGSLGITLSAEERALEQKYALRKYCPLLSELNYKRNLWTLWTLEQVLAAHLRSRLQVEEVLEPGSQDFSRLPALRAFFQTHGHKPRITALEVDPFPVLDDLHSRWDRAHYYLALETSRDRFLAADFFGWHEQADLLLCFYPFVSLYPALAWGLPAAFGDARPWMKSYERCLRPGGLLLVVHQGEWEQEEFDQAREGSSLTLLKREALACPFFPSPHPPYASVYRKKP